MNKKTKGIVAGAAGAAILLGTAGTFALWTDTTTAPGAVVTGGQLEISAGATTWTWSDISGAQGAVSNQPATETIRLVPGVELKGTTVITPEIVGDHLIADLSATTGTAAVPAWLEVTWTLDGVALTSGTTAVLTPANVLSDPQKDLAVHISLDPDFQNSTEGKDLTTETAWTSGSFTVTLQQGAPSRTVTP